VPGWHAATKELEDDGKLRVAGIVEEQHRDRALLFMQWKGMDWPLMVDQLNLLGVWLVPITVLIDEYGIVRSIPPHGADPVKVLEEFLAADFAPPVEPADAPPRPRLSHQTDRRSSPEEFRPGADHLVLWGGDDGLDGAIDAYRHAIELEPEDATTRFRLGVAFRARYDSTARRGGDFQAAVFHWTNALADEPNQYIWRRRIQQYGPRLDKPYPFYDWVPSAREALEARGLAPHPLFVEPAGAEFAGPIRNLETDRLGEPSDPDPGGKVHRDPGRLIRLGTTVVPAEIPPGGAVRIHLEMTPDSTVAAHWNNEAGDHVVWIDLPTGWHAGERLAVLPPGTTAVSGETRRLDLEVRAPAEAAAPTAVSGHTLYYVCEGADGVCMYRRQDFEIDIPVSGDAPRLGDR
jgi:hypothetical protein